MPIRNLRRVIFMKLIVANWKMEPQTESEAVKLARAVAKKARGLQNTRTVICPPFVFLNRLKKTTDNAWCVLGAQDVFWEDRGAHTGEISPFMLKDMGVKYVLAGHSERRAEGETDETVNKKIKAILAHGLTAILCIGELLRADGGEHFRVVENQARAALMGISKGDVSRIVIAYEPVWAVGERALRAATPEDFFEMAISIRKTMATLFGNKEAQEMRVLYGGSVDEKNTRDFIKKGNADGLLVGRASLDAKKFGAILERAEHA